MPKGFSSRTSRSLGGILGLATSVFCLYWVTRKLDFEAFLHELKNLHWGVFAFIVGIAGLHNFVMAARWRLLLSRYNLVSFSDAFWSLRISYFLNCVLPAKLGEPFRLFFLKKRRQVSVAHALGAHVADKILDSGSLILIVCISALVLGLRGHPWIAESLFALLLILGVFSLVLRFLPHDSPKKGGVVLRFIAKAKTGLKILLDLKILFPSLGWSFLGWLLHMFIVWGLILGVGESLSLFKVAIVVGAVSLAAALPSSPGNFGPFELAAIACLNSVFNIDREKAVSVALLYHFAQLIPTILFGVIGYYRHGFGGKLN